MERSVQLMQANTVIVGGGLAGISASWAFHRQGEGSCVVLSRGAGASPQIDGIALPLSPGDSAAQFAADTLAAGNYQGDEALVNALCGDSLGVPALLEGLGLSLDRGPDETYQLRRALGSGMPRVAGIGNVFGSRIVTAMKSKTAQDGDTRYLQDVHALRLDAPGRVLRGVLVYDARDETLGFIQCRSLVLACGGYCGIYPFSTNGPDTAGDGIGLLYEAGVPLTDLEFIQFEPTVAVYPVKVRGKGMISTLFHEGAVLRNRSGERFLRGISPKAEQIRKDLMAELIYREIARGGGTGHGGVYFDATAVGKERLDEAYGNYVARYRHCGMDISREYIEVAPAPHTSLGGAMIHPDCSTTIEGLYVCGEAAGGIHGANRVGGNAGLETLVFGVRAGRAAAQHAAQDGKVWPEAGKRHTDGLILPLREGKGMEDRDLGVIHEEMRGCISSALNIVRDANSLRYAGTQLASLYDQAAGFPAESPPALYRKLRVLNDLTAARLSVLSALARRSSNGCHIREDSVDEEERYRLLVYKTDRGAEIRKVPVDLSEDLAGRGKHGTE